MAILVDEARWRWQGSDWAHLVSDHSYAELHAFAATLGKRRLGFQGDHYDVDAVDRSRAIAAGAVPVDSRTLVRRLRDAGLRDRHAKPSWVRVATWPAGVSPAGLPDPFAGVLAAVALDLTAPVVALFEDDRRRAVLVDVPPRLAFDATHPALIQGGARVDGWRSVEMIVSR